MSEDDKKKKYHREYKRRQRAAKKNEVIDEAAKLLEKYYEQDYTVKILQDTHNIINLLLEQLLVVRADMSLDTVSRGRTLSYIAKTIVDIKTTSELEKQIQELAAELERLRDR